LPKQSDGKTLDPIAEEEARDLLEFLIVVYSDENIKAPKLKKDADVLQPDDLDEYAAQVLNASPNLYATSLLVT